MLKAFNIYEFEQFFSEKNLAWAYLAVNKKNVNKLSGKKLAFTVLDNASEKRVGINKNGQKIKEYSCSCKMELCKHIAAVLFYLEEEKINLANKKQTQNKTSNSKAVFENYLRQSKTIVSQVIINKQFKGEVKKIENEFNILLKQAIALHPHYIHQACWALLYGLHSFLTVRSYKLTDFILKYSDEISKQAHLHKFNFVLIFENELFEKLIRSVFKKNSNCFGATYKYLFFLLFHMRLSNEKLIKLKKQLSIKAKKAKTYSELNLPKASEFLLQFVMKNKIGIEYYEAEFLPEFILAKIEYACIENTKINAAKILNKNNKQLDKHLKKEALMEWLIRNKNI
ncbi:MAG: hypothetical protein JSU07_05340 [Bacteroidetes bacterium]|nr:hypothetical protein [Bacteroidota bacterium]